MSKPRQVEVRVLVDLPQDVQFTDEQLRAWLHFEFRSCNQMLTVNPLDGVEPDVVWNSMTVRDYR